MLLRCTKSEVREVRIYHQDHDDPDDGTKAGWYAQVGQPDDEADFWAGPYPTKALAYEGAVRVLKGQGYKVAAVRPPTKKPKARKAAK